MGARRVHRGEALAAEGEVAVPYRPRPVRLLTRAVAHHASDGGRGEDRCVEVDCLLGPPAHIPDEHEGGRDALRDLRLARHGRHPVIVVRQHDTPRS